MALRVTTNILIERSISDINSNLRRLQELQQQISAGKRILRPSDDPIGTSRAISYTKELDKNSTYQLNITEGINRMTAAERVLENMLDVIMEIQGTAQEGLTIGASLERASISASINTYLEAMLQDANAKFQGKFLFGGMETLSGTAPFSAPFNPVYGPDGLISGVVQNTAGINDILEYEVAEGDYAAVNVSGAAPFQPNGEGGAYDIFQTLINIRDALTTNDMDTANAELANLGREYDTILSQASLLGARIGSLESAQVQKTALGIDLKEYLSSTVDLDLAEAIIHESYQQYLYNASLQIGAKIIPQSLLDFI
jgi:flagellar hook-associated protein 3 FlgL